MQKMLTVVLLLALAALAGCSKPEEDVIQVAPPPVEPGAEAPAEPADEATEPVAEVVDEEPIEETEIPLAEIADPYQRFCETARRALVQAQTQAEAKAYAASMEDIEAARNALQAALGTKATAAAKTEIGRLLDGLDQQLPTTTGDLQQLIDQVTELRGPLP